MTKPIQAGDLAEVVGGFFGSESPNLGLIVKVLSLRGQHSTFGNIWRCEAQYAELGQPGIGCPPGQADFAQHWLRKIEPPAQTDSTETNISKEIAA
jgi:hypothetical protein